MRQLILDLLPDLAPTIDNFVAGRSVEALEALSAWLGSGHAPGHAETVFFLWGETGSGKSHLLQGSVWARPGVYFDAAADPALSTLGALCTEDSEAAADTLVAVDSVSRLDEAGQVVLFNYFNHIKMSGGSRKEKAGVGGRLLVADRDPPLQLQSRLREDLRTRLGSGLIYRVWPLNDADKQAALAAVAEARALRLPDGALDYLLAHLPRDMRSLSGFVHALDRYSLTHKRPITMALLREVLREMDMIERPFPDETL